MLFKFKNRSFNFDQKNAVLAGIINVTPDSFSDGGKFDSTEAALHHALQLEKDGADFLDIGAESTRPGSNPVSIQEELNRLIPVIRALKDKIKIPISIDTTKSQVADAALAEGIDIINDVSGLRADPKMARLAAAADAGLILMHSRGTPATMNTLCTYQNLVEDVKKEVLASIQQALDAGIPADHLAIDPGIGFAKTKEQNLELLQHLKEFCQLPYPVMIGVSRKSFLGGEVKDRGPATLAVELSALKQGVRMIRTHDVSAIRKAAPRNSN